MSTSTLGPQPAVGGLHWIEWLCELLGTLAMILVGFSAIALFGAPQSPLHAAIGSAALRAWLTGLTFGVISALVALSPLGRRSGAHLNPVVTLAFWTQGKVHPHDVAGYVSGQVVGAICGTAATAVVWGAEARAVHLGATAPGRGVGPVEAVLVEAAMTGALVLTLLLMTSRAVTARWTPLVLWLLIAALVWQGAPYTGTSLNPARSLGPALLAPLLGPLWVYLLGPLLGGAAAVAVFGLLGDVEVQTAKLFHDGRYRSTLGSALPARPG